MLPLRLFTTPKADSWAAFMWSGTSTNELEHDLRVLVWEVWQDIEDACEVKRKPRYQ